MKTINFLCADARSLTLDDFAGRIFELLGAKDCVARYSSNYAEEKYFVGHVGNEDITVALSDEDGFDDLAYWVCFDFAHDDNAVQKVDFLVRESLIPAGIHVARIDNFGRRDMQRVDY